MSLHRSVVAAALAATLLTAGCSDDSSADPTPVTAGPTTSVAPTTTAGIETTTTTAQAATSTTSVSPPVTKPLTTAPPSELLTEVTAAYDAAYADLLAAGSIPDENYAGLGSHMDDGQADQWRTVVRGLRESGQRLVRADPTSRWRRIEDITEVSSSVVTLSVCRFDPDSTIDSSGAVVAQDQRAYRYVETFQRSERGWLWTGREWVDPSKDWSDCSLQ